MTRSEFRKRWINHIIKTAHVSETFAKTYFRQRSHTLYYPGYPEAQADIELLCLPAAVAFFT
jgi:hypothetical protein